MRHGTGNMQGAILTKLAGRLTVRFRFSGGKNMTSNTTMQMLSRSGYGVLFFQRPSTLNFQQELKRKYNRSNAENARDVWEIPINNQITWNRPDLPKPATTTSSMRKSMGSWRTRFLSPWRGCGILHGETSITNTACIKAREGRQRSTPYGSGGGGVTGTEG
ncbi:hypothetical protein Holit_02983 [Hollandina sp. SP2]